MKKSKRQKSCIGANGVVPARLAGLVRVAGPPIQFEIERHSDETRIDHVWLDIEAGDEAFFRIALNTWSRNSFASGLDPRMRLAIVASTWDELPLSGVFHSDGLDYSTIETESGCGFQPYERSTLEQLLIKKFERAICIEAWGELYERGHRGLHQSTAVAAARSFRLIISAATTQCASITRSLHGRRCFLSSLRSCSVQYLPDFHRARSSRLAMVAQTVRYSRII